MQILSIFVDQFSQSELQQMLPDVTLYKINQAKRHLLEKGRGLVAFIASPHLVQDVAHGMRTLRLCIVLKPILTLSVNAVYTEFSRAVPPNSAKVFKA